MKIKIKKPTEDNINEIKTWLSCKKQIVDVTKIPGDASTRRYYRVETVSGLTLVLMRMDAFSDSGDQLPFLVMQKHLNEAKVDVPQVLDFDPEQGMILLEDLGDVTLLKKLQTVSSPDTERHIYEKVIDSLVHLQVNASPSKKPASIEAYRLRFDFEKLMWEVNFTVEHFYKNYLKRSIQPGDLRIFEAEFGKICAALAAEPLVLTHRDFHSRNVMVVPRGSDERFVMIDFQDARMGPAQYDLASLLRDSYYQLEESQIDCLIDYYVARYEAVSGYSLSRPEFRRIFDWMSVQRNFKAIGSFSSFMNNRGDATYLKYIGNTFENIRRTLLKYPEFSNLRETLFHYYYF